MSCLGVVCVVGGVLRGLVIDPLAPVAKSLVGEAMPRQASVPWLSIVPIAESRSSYNGLIILLFLVGAATMTAMMIHRFATRATRSGDIWDCGYPLDATTTQYTGSSFAMPIRRVFGAVVFQVHDSLDMPKPGEMRAGHFRVRMSDPAWRVGYGPLARFIAGAAARLHRLHVPAHR